MTASSVTIALQLFAAVVGLIAAYFWLAAARVETPNFEVIGTYTKGPESFAPIAKWAKDAANHNKRAAVLTAVSILLGVISLIFQMIS
jgi:hypothetical protein